MKKLLIAASLSTALISSFNAAASNDVTLKVIGNIIPGACVPTLPNGGIVDYGTIRNGNIDPTGQTNKLVQLGQKTVTLTVTCDTDIAVAVTSSDNRSDTHVALGPNSFIEGALPGGENVGTTSNGFGLGSASNGNKIGSYIIAFDIGSATADGNSVDVLSTGNVNASAVTWEKSTNGAFCSLTSGCSDSARAYTVAATGSLTPKAFKVLSAPMLITTAVQDNSVLGTADKITLDGNATISLVYL
ncbi:DUF1120 domain-containing protein [Enterobacter mori]|uniref:DUF1120 domain-containing protein n=1 Tax=Enterobacter mori TaxID=539813 RepID=UPI003AAE8A3B